MFLCSIITKLMKINEWCLSISFGLQIYTFIYNSFT
jgi:hypothetical protein